MNENSTLMESSPRKGAWALAPLRSFTRNIRKDSTGKFLGDLARVGILKGFSGCLNLSFAIVPWFVAHCNLLAHSEDLTQVNGTVYNKQTVLESLSRKSQNARSQSLRHFSECTGATFIVDQSKRKNLCLLSSLPSRPSGCLN